MQLSNLSLFYGTIALALFGLFEAVPLFFGAVFGSWVGLVTGAVGFLVGVYLSWVYLYPDGGLGFSFYYSTVWLMHLYAALIGLAAGGATSRTQGQYNTLHNLALAEIYSLVGVVVAMSLALCILDIQFHILPNWYQLVIFIYLLPGLVLLPILLVVYQVSVERVKYAREHFLTHNR